MIGHTFYFCGLIVFLANLSFLFNFFEYLKIKEWYVSFEKITKSIPTKKEFRQGDYDKFRKFNGVFALNFLWFFFGIVGQNWKIFMLLIFIHLFTQTLSKLIGQFLMFIKFFQFMIQIIISSTILLLCINHFHLHLDLFELLWRHFTR
jgi:hypothetical protein